MKKQHVTRFTSLWLALLMVLCSIFGPVPLVMAQEAVTDAETVLEVGEAAEVPDEVTEEIPEAEQAAEVEEAAEEALVGSGLTDFTSPQDGLTIDEEAGTVTVSNTGGDHFAVYNGLNEEVNSFTLEADVLFKQDQDINSAALIFGLSSKTAPGAHWNGANVDSGRTGDDAFRMFGPDLNETNCGSCAGVDFTIPVHFKLQVNEKGEFTYSFGNNGVEPGSKSGKLNSWNGGYVGVLTWNSEATFSNITFEGEYIDTSGEATELDDDPRFNTNLTGLKSTSGTWEVTDDGLRSDSRGLGDSFLFSETSCDNFVYSTDVKFISDGGAASLIFRNASTSNKQNCYAVNFDNGSKRGKFWRWVDGRDMVIGNERECPESSDGTYTLKVVAYDGWVSYYVNNTVIASTGDYTLQADDRGQNTCLFDGYFGLLNWNGEMVFQNTLFTPIDGDFNPLLEDITVESSGTVEKKGQFFSLNSRFTFSM